MNLYLLLSIIGASFFSICLTILLIKFKLPPSLSESFYNLGGMKKNGILFYVMLLVTVFILITPMVQATDIWGFLSGVGLLFVGAAPAFKEEDQRYIHIVGALMSAICAIVQLILMQKLIWILPVFCLIAILAIVTKSYKKSLTFWLEMIAFYSLFLGLILFFI